jgi:hypothetical protein
MHSHRSLQKSKVVAEASQPISDEKEHPSLYSTFKTRNSLYMASGSFDLKKTTDNPESKFTHFKSQADFRKINPAQSLNPVLSEKRLKIQKEVQSRDLIKDLRTKANKSSIKYYL